MMLIIQAVREADQPAFQDRVRYLIVKAAINIIAEGSETVNHAARVSLAHNILSNPKSYVSQFSQAVITQVDLTALTTLGDIDDTTLETKVNSVYNDFI